MNYFGPACVLKQACVNLTFWNSTMLDYQLIEKVNISLKETFLILLVSGVDSILDP